MTLQQRVPKDQIWAIIKTIISCMNPIVSACVMNQSRRHWLLSNALTTTINISRNMEAEVMGLGDGFKILDEFDLELVTLQKNM
jgi:hypothetical protein